MSPEHRYPVNIEHALGRFRSEAKQIVASYVETLPSGPPAIYHYTNDLGLNGILGTGKMWLTDIFSLNDPSEVRHGFCHGINILKRKVAGGPPRVKRFAQGLETFFSEVGVESSGHHFICSFSSCRDDLCQWRAYADNGRGYALGFDANVMEEGFTKAPNTEAFYLTYDDSKLDALLGQIVESYLSAVNLGLILQGGVGAHGMADLYTWLTLYLLRAALFFKHAAYANEKEYRFLQYYGADGEPPAMERRARSYSVIKYMEFDWKSVAAGALKHIMIGPAAEPEKASHFAAECLRLGNVKTIPVIRSPIPYRAI